LHTSRSNVSSTEFEEIQTFREKVPRRIVSGELLIEKNKTTTENIIQTLKNESKGKK